MAFVIQYLCSSLTNASLLVFLSQRLRNRLTAWRVAVISLGSSLLLIPVYHLGWNEGIPVNIAGSLFVICMTAFFFRDSAARQTVYLAFFLLLMGICDAIGAAAIAMPHGHIGRTSIGMLPTLIHSALSTAVYILLGSAFIITQSMLGAKRVQPFLFLFLILPIGQIITIYGFLFLTWTGFWVLSVVLSFVADLVLLAYTISQEKKVELEESLREIRNQRELEQLHYNEVERRREELHIIRDSFNRQLASAARYIDIGEEESARNLIRSLADEINNTKENPYCAIPVVNAVLTEKARECTELHIDLHVALELPPHITISQMHLCSIFSNLMDNAIEACKRLPQGTNPAIRLSAKRVGDYLLIKVINPSKVPAKTLAGRGYGSRILSDLAAWYGGAYQGEYKNGVFTAITSILAADAMAEE